MKKNQGLLFVLLGGCLSYLLSCNSSNSNNSTVSVSDKNNVYNYNSPGVKTPEALKLFDAGLQSAQQDDFNSAQQYFRKANNIEPNNPIIIDAIGSVHSSTGNFDSAIYYFNLSLKIDSLTLVTYIDYGQTLNMEGQYKEALNMFFKGKKLAYDSTSEYALYIDIAASYHYLKKCDAVKQYTDTARLLVQNKPGELKQRINNYADTLIKKCQQ